MQQEKMKYLENLVGKTPMLELIFDYKGEERRIFVKNESYNLTGSIKDRMAFYTLKKAYEKNEIKKGAAIVEATSGNTGIAFSAMGAILGHPVIIYMPDWMSEERKSLIRSFGAKIVLVSREEGGFLGSIEKTKEYAKNNPDTYLPSQFSNPYNSEAHYYGIGLEIVNEMKSLNLNIDGFVAGVGTGGTVMGIGQRIKENFSNAKICPLEPLNSPTLSTGYKVAKHRIEGISDEFIPDLIKLDKLDDVVSVDDGDAIVMAQKLAKCGLGVGISSGANFIGALMLQNKLGKDSVIVTVFPDDNKKYLSTDLMKSEKVKEDFSSLKENDNDFQEKISTDEDERNKKINKNFEDALDLHLNAETDEEFQKAEEDFSSFIKTYKDFPDKPPALENLLTEASSYLVASKFRVKRLVGYLTFADILGWKGIWQKQNTDVGKIDNLAIISISICRVIRSHC